MGIFDFFRRNKKAEHRLPSGGMHIFKDQVFLHATRFYPGGPSFIAAPFQMLTVHDVAAIASAIQTILATPTNPLSEEEWKNQKKVIEEPFLKAIGEKSIKVVDRKYMRLGFEATNAGGFAFHPTKKKGSGHIGTEEINVSNDADIHEIKKCFELALSRCS